MDEFKDVLPQAIVWRWVDGNIKDQFEADPEFWTEDRITRFLEKWGPFVDKWGLDLLELIRGALEDEPEMRQDDFRRRPDGSIYGRGGQV